MNRDETYGAPDGQLVTTGSLTSGNPGRPRRRWPMGVLAVVGAGLLAGGFVTQAVSGRPPGRVSATLPIPAASGTRTTDGSTALPDPLIRGRRAFAVDSARAAASVVLDAAERMRTDAVRSTLLLRLHLNVWAGAEILSTDTFTSTCAGRPTVDRASGVIVLRPGPRIQLVTEGFSISAPSSVDVRVVLDVPPGDCVVSLVGGPDRRALAHFRVTG